MDRPVRFAAGLQRGGAAGDRLADARARGLGRHLGRRRPDPPHPLDQARRPPLVPEHGVEIGRAAAPSSARSWCRASSSSRWRWPSGSSPCCSRASAPADWFWGWVLPPVFILIGWAIYDRIDDRVHEHAGALYDKATGGPAVSGTDAAAPAVPSPQTADRAARAAGRPHRRAAADAGRTRLEQLDPAGVSIAAPSTVIGVSQTDTTKGTPCDTHSSSTTPRCPPTISTPRRSPTAMREFDEYAKALDAAGNPRLGRDAAAVAAHDDRAQGR